MATRTAREERDQSTSSSEEDDLDSSSSSSALDDDDQESVSSEEERARNVFNTMPPRTPKQSKPFDFSSIKLLNYDDMATISSKNSKDKNPNNKGNVTSLRNGTR